MGPLASPMANVWRSSKRRTQMSTSDIIDVGRGGLTRFASTRRMTSGRSGLPMARASCSARLGRARLDLYLKAVDTGVEPITADLATTYGCH